MISIAVLLAIVILGCLLRSCYLHGDWNGWKRGFKEGSDLRDKHSVADNSLGYGWRCSYCRLFKDEGEQTGVYWLGTAVCKTCATKVQTLRSIVDSQTSGPIH